MQTSIGRKNSRKENVLYFIHHKRSCIYLVNIFTVLCTVVVVIIVKLEWQSNPSLPSDAEVDSSTLWPLIGQAVNAKGWMNGKTKSFWDEKALARRTFYGDIFVRCLSIMRCRIFNFTVEDHS